MDKRVALQAALASFLTVGVLAAAHAGPVAADPSKDK